MAQKRRFPRTAAIRRVRVCPVVLIAHPRGQQLRHVPRAALHHVIGCDRHDEVVVKRAAIAACLGPGAVACLMNSDTFLEFSLCLSRACLGKIMHFIYKWRKKCRFLTALWTDSSAARRIELQHPPDVLWACRNRLLPQLFLICVPSLSWQNNRF